MATIRLEFEELKILRPKKRWKLYFLIITDHPTEKDKKVIANVPQLQPFFRLKPQADNILDFEPDNQKGSDGLFVLEREMPKDRKIHCRVYLRHSRRSLRNAGQFLKELELEIGSNNILSKSSEILNTASTWAIVPNKVLPLLGQAITKIKDRDFGMVSMDEEFGSEFESQTEIDRSNKFSSGNAIIVWSWSIKDESE